MLKAGMMVQAEVALRENPWAEAGKVIGFAPTNPELVSVQWPDFPVPVWEEAWTLREVDPHLYRQPGLEGVSHKEQQRIDSAELSKL